MSVPSLNADDLTYAYAAQLALNGVSFRVEPGSVYALVGPNGAGKTTLIQILMNLRNPTSGSVEVLGLPSTRVKGAVLGRIGYVSENQELPDDMSICEFLQFLRPFYPTWDQRLEDRLLADFNLPVNRELGHLSRGMRMKVAFVASLSYRPEILILDEPFSGLDPLVRDELIQGLLEGVGETTVFLSSHDLAEIEGVASHVGYLEQGRLVFSEELTSLQLKYRHVSFRVNGFVGFGDMPDSWLECDRFGTRVGFKESAFKSEAVTVAQVRSRFPGAADFSFASMSLRDIFLANARTNRDVRKDQSKGA